MITIESRIRGSNIKGCQHRSEIQEKVVNEAWVIPFEVFDP